MEFLEVVENIRRETESVDRFVEMLDGRDASPAALAEHQGERFGSNLSARLRTRRDRDPQYMRTLALFAQTLAEARRGQRTAIRMIEEAMGTSDFPLLFGDILDRQMLANYREWPRVYNAFMRVATVPDFRPVSRHAIDGAEGVFDQVDELAEYPFAALDEKRYTYAVAKYGRKLAFSWESIINDDFNGLAGSSPARLGRGARRTENKFATSLYVDSAGPHASLYTADNIITGNPALDIDGLEAGLAMLMQMQDEDGEPIVVEAVHLVVPTALEITANQIVSTVQRRITQGSDNEMIVSGNGLPRNLQVHTDPYISVIAQSNGDTSWFLFADPNIGRPALEIGFLRGHTEPELFVKEPNARRVGGGTVNPLDGDFDVDGIQYKARHVVGGTRLDWRATVASNGSVSS